MYGLDKAMAVQMYCDIGTLRSDFASPVARGSPVCDQEASLKAIYTLRARQHLLELLG
jgi:hypothetical protein